MVSQLNVFKMFYVFPLKLRIILEHDWPTLTDKYMEIYCVTLVIPLQWAQHTTNLKLT